MTVLPQLKIFFKTNMFPKDSHAQLFDFQYRDNKFTMLFTIEIESNKPEKRELLFVKVGTQETFHFDIDNNFNAKTYLSIPELNRFKNFFDIPFSFDPKNKFKVSKFLLEIDQKIKPVNYKSVPRTTISAAHRLENPNAVYYDSAVNWTTRNKENPDKKPMHVTGKNRIKVEKLLPQLYKQIKTKDITIYFTETPKDSLTETHDIALDVSKF